MNNQQPSLRILHIARFENNPYSGVANAIPPMLKHQGKLADVTLLNIHEDGLIKSDPLLNYKTILYSKSILDSVLKNKFDLAIFHEIYWPQFIPIYRSLKHAGIPYIILPHGSLTKRAQHTRRLKKIIGNLLLFNSFIYGAKAIHFLSEQERKSSSRFNAVPNFITGNGIDNTDTPIRHIRPKKSTRFTFIGRLDIKIKGIDILLDTVKRYHIELKKQGALFTIAGSDHKNGHAEILKLINTYGIQDIVTLGGPVNGEAKRKLLEESDYFIQLSRTEGQPMGIIEALNLGIPIVVTEGTTFAQRAEHFEMGYRCDSHPEKVFASISQAISATKSTRNKLSSNAKKYVLEFHEWSGIANNLIREYKEFTK